MQQLIRRELDGVVAHIAHSTRSDGDLSPSNVPTAELAARRRSLVPGSWHAVHQVHSDRVITVSCVEDARAPRVKADALVTTEPGLVLAVHSGDCVPVGFVSDRGAVAASHAGWKGLEAGVLESTVREIRGTHGAAPIHAVVGPHIRKDRYEFSESDLDRLSARFGPQARAHTVHNTPALDLTAAVAHELEKLQVDVVAWSPDCTARDEDQYWSHRARSEPGRIALVAWLEDVS